MTSHNFKTMLYLLLGGERMFLENEKHQQRKMFTTIDQLPPAAKKRLERSWAQCFYRDYFSKIDETTFAVLYSKKKSRPNTPVNILVGFETLKSGFGWSDEELYDHFLFDLQIRYALGIHDLDEGYFDLRTIYNFRASLVEYEDLYQVNLIKKATEKITDEQIKQFKIKTGVQRMDSTQIQSNIRHMSRIQLIVEIIQRLHRILRKSDKEIYGSYFTDYIKDDSLHYCYKIKRDEAASRLEQIGKDLAFFVEKFDNYTGITEYEQAKRVFHEHFCFEEEQLIIKKGKDMGGNTLQSPDDPEATYRRKNGEKARGYVANITETCDPENDIQLITAVSVESNTTDDQKLLEVDIQELKERTDIEEVVTDAGYTGPVAASALETVQVNQTATAIKGRKKQEDTIGLDDFKINRTKDGDIESLECPHGKKGEVKNTQKAGRYSAAFESDSCMQCPFAAKCPAKPLKKKALWIVRFSDDMIRVAMQRQKLKENKGAVNIRASVENTVRCVIHPFGGHLCKMPVRGKKRIKTMILLSAMMVNIRRITKNMVEKLKNVTLQPVWA